MGTSHTGCLIPEEIFRANLMFSETAFNPVNRVFVSLTSATTFSGLILNLSASRILILKPLALQ